MTRSRLNSWTVAEKMGRVLRDLNVQTLLSAKVGIDLMDSNQHILTVSITVAFTEAASISIPLLL